MTETVKVTMNLTTKDASNTEEIQKSIHARSKAGAVSYSLSLASMLIKEVEKGGDIYIKDKNGQTHKVMFAI